MKNYLRLKSLIPFRQKYIFLDTEPYTADRIFIANKLYVKFKEEYSKKEFPDYVLIHCWVLKRKSKVFEKCVSILHDQLMLSCGRSIIC